MASCMRIAFALLSCVIVAASHVDFAEVRSHVSHAMEERVHELKAVLEVLQDVSKATMAGIAAVEAKCGTSR